MQLIVPLCPDASGRILMVGFQMIDYTEKPARAAGLQEDRFYEEHGNWLGHLIYRFFEICTT